MKRGFDILVSFTAIITFAPIISVVAVFVYVKLGSPIFFKQNRPGLHGKIFKMYKFRTMKHAVNVNNEVLADSERLCDFGLKLRSTSLDELPSLWNVLIGDMSLVGPRPLLVEYIPLYSKEQAKRHHVRPGITGWAQINGRNAISWDEKFKLDVWYVQNQSFWLDLKILFLTIKKVLVKEGISQDCEATMSRFEGTNK